MEKDKKISTQSYKGVRDFFPEDMSIENAIFSIWRDVCRSYGYEEYGASVLEPAELYQAKSGEEIVNEQTYTFTDRGERQVTLRPEMTPTVARMIAARRRDLSMPVRWFSIPNLFRYEQPQKGRLREHWQLNVDLFGVSSTNADIEVINMAYDIVRKYGLKDNQFEIRLNNRKVMNYITKDVYGLSEDLAYKTSKLIDRKHKVNKEAFELGIEEIFTLSGQEKSAENAESMLTLLESANFDEFVSRLPQTKEEHQGIRDLRELISGLDRLGIRNVRFDQTLMRGFDYYTGNVFEIFDLNPDNRRSVFGGGRYDDLLSIFGNDKVPAFGFGAGDVVARDVMETYQTLPAGEAPADIGICIVGDKNLPYALDIAQKLRNKGQKVSVDITGKKIGDQISAASKKKIPEIMVIGDDEVRTGTLTKKNLASGQETKITEDQI
jgi:histidyl-tRNA synthetase